MAVGVTSLLRRSVPGAVCHDYQRKIPDATSGARPLSLRSQVCGEIPGLFGNAGRCCTMPATPLKKSMSWPGNMQIWSSSQFVPLQSRLTRRVAIGRSGRGGNLIVTAASGDSNGRSDTAEGGKTRQSRTRAREDVASLREKLNNYIERKAGYIWLGGPIVATAAIVIPPAMVSVIDLLQKNYWLGLSSIFGLDIIFVLAADLFFVLADKAGHHQSIAGGPPPWIGPWEYTGYPKGEPTLTKVVSYVGAAIGVLGLGVSLLFGKIGAALPALGSYLALIFVQVAYERLLSNDRVAAYPLVPIVYTVYRFKQLARGMELVSAMGGGVVLAMTIRALMVVWTFYLSMHLTKVPWLYSTWNSNRAT